MQALFFAHLIATLLESFRLSLNHIARYALSRKTKIFLIKIHKSLAKQFIDVSFNWKLKIKVETFH